LIQVSPDKDSTRNYIHSLELLLNVSNILAQTLNIDELLSEVIDQIFNLLKRIDRGAILLLDKETHKLKEMVSKTRMVDKEGVFSKINYSRSIVKRTIKAGEPVMMSDTRRVAKAELSDSMEQMNVMSVMCVPLTYKGEVRGVIYVDSIGLPEGFRRDDLHLLTSLSNTAATAIENARLYGAVKQELSERKRAEEELRESEQKMKAILRASPIGIGLVINRHLDWANETMYRMVGYEEGSLLGHSAAVLYPNDKEYERVGRELYVGITESGIGQVETRWIRKDGTIFDCILAACSLDPTDPSRGHIVTVDDITARKQAEKKLTASLKEKEVLLKEIHHRVKNNMQVISSMLSLQSQHITDKASLAMFQESQNRIRAMALIHEKLYTSEDLAHIDIASYIHSLTHQLITTYHTLASRVNMDIAITNIFLTITTAIPCGLIINELVSNALKHAFPHQQDGTITVSMTPSNTDSLILTVSDTGIGFPEGIDFRNTTTLGMQLVVSLVEQLEGTITLDRNEGTRFRIEFRTQE
jgi:PAS domain S-box-containing protein